jgi:hypothetical protein
MDLGMVPHAKLAPEVVELLTATIIGRHEPSLSPPTTATWGRVDADLITAKQRRRLLTTS